MTALDPPKHFKARGGLRPHFDALVIVAFACAMADAVSTYCPASVGLGREQNPALSELVEHQPWSIFLCFAVLLAPVPFFPKLARLTAATGLALGHGLCVVINTTSWIPRTAWLTRSLPLWTVGVVPAVVAIGVFVVLKFTRLRKESAPQAAVWLAGYGVYVAVLGLACWLVGIGLAD